MISKVLRRNNNFSVKNTRDNSLYDAIRYKIAAPIAIKKLIMLPDSGNALKRNIVAQPIVSKNSAQNNILILSSVLFPKLMSRLSSPQWYDILLLSFNT